MAVKNKPYAGTLNYQMQKIINDHAQNLSFGSRHNLECNLHALAEYLRSNFPNLALAGLGARHIDAYVEHLMQRGNVARTVINTITHLRFLAKSIGKAPIVHRTNRGYGFERISRTGTVNRGIVLSAEQLESLDLKHHSFRAAAELQKLFALRLEEAGRLTVHQADRGGYLALAGSACKNGRPRNVPITTPDQRTFLNAIKAFKGKNESVAGHEYATIKSWKRGYLSAMQSIGVRSHSIRHAAIQEWYRRGTGLEPPICGGPRFRDMPQDIRETARAFCFQLTESVGHSRIDVLAHYLGKL